jgi:uncharacterized protein YjiS (DUF1127 family)
MTVTEDIVFSLIEAPSRIAGEAWARCVMAVTWLDHCLEVRRQRSTLLLMDGHMLKDIGLSRADVECEAGRKFWDAGKR